MFGLLLPQMSLPQLAILGERPMSLPRLLQGNDSFHGMTCALTNMWHQWNRNGKLYADFPGAGGAGNSLLHGYRLFCKGGIDSIPLSQLEPAGTWEDVKQNGTMGINPNCW